MDLGILGILNHSYSQGGWPRRASGWQGVGETYSTSAIPGLVGGGIGAGLGALTGNPILTALLVDLGSQAASELIGSVFGRQTASEQAALATTQAGQRLIPQLEAQARGEPTAATEAQMRQLRQASTRMGQSYAASARRGGLGAPTLGGGQPTVSRAQQGRYQAAQLQGMANIMGQSQMAAQQQLGGMYQQALPMQRQMELYDIEQRQKGASNIANLIARFQQSKAKGTYDARQQAFYERLLRIVEGMLGEQRGQ